MGFLSPGGALDAQDSSGRYVMRASSQATCDHLKPGAFEGARLSKSPPIHPGWENVSIRICFYHTALDICQAALEGGTVLDLKAVIVPN